MLREQTRGPPLLGPPLAQRAATSSSYILQGDAMNIVDYAVVGVLLLASVWSGFSGGGKRSAPVPITVAPSSRVSASDLF
jgi:hypothetical protein